MAYIYQHIRTRGFEPIHFDEYYTYLEAAFVTHFREPMSLSREELQREIEITLRNERFSPSTMNAVEVRCYSDGAVEIEAKEILYNTFSMRALHPYSYMCRISGNLLTANTSAKAALVEFNRATMQTAERSVAIWANDEDEVIAIDGSPVIAVFEDEVRFARNGEGVEFDLAYDVVVKLGRNATRGAIKLADLSEAKELIFIGYEGLTAVHSYLSTRYMDILAEKIAAKIAEAEQE